MIGEHALLCVRHRDSATDYTSDAGSDVTAVQVRLSELNDRIRTRETAGRRRWRPREWGANLGFVPSLVAQWGVSAREPQLVTTALLARLFARAHDQLNLEFCWGQPELCASLSPLGQLCLPVRHDDD